MKVTTIGDCVVFSNNAMYLENILDEIRRQFDVYSVTKCSHRVGIPRQLCCSSIHAKHVLMTIMLKACVRLEVQFGLHIPHKLHASNMTIESFLTTKPSSLFVLNYGTFA